MGALALQSLLAHHPASFAGDGPGASQGACQCLLTTPKRGDNRMADVLLTHSYHLPYDPKQVRKMQPYAPLGTLYAASALRAGNISVAVFDTMLEAPEPGFADALNQLHPKIVAIYEDDFNFLSQMCLTRMRELAWH